MYRPSKYELSQDSLIHFADIFNLEVFAYES